MITDIAPDAWQQIYAVALSAARGDERTALSMLQGCYLEMASRLVISEQASDHWLDTIAMFCQVASDRLGDAASYYMGATQSDEEARLGKLHGAQHEAARFASQLRHRFETFPETRTPDPTDEHDAIDALLES